MYSFSIVAEEGLELAVRSYHKPAFKIRLNHIPASLAVLANHSPILAKPPG